MLLPKYWTFLLTHPVQTVEIQIREDRLAPIYAPQKYWVFIRNHPVYAAKTQIMKEIFESQENRTLYSLTQIVHKARHRVIIISS